MEKRISYDQFQAVKRVAQACNPLVQKKERIGVQLEKLIKENDTCDMQIQALEAGILQIIGFHVFDLVQKVTEEGKDSKGNPVKTVKYLPTEIVTYDKDTKQYVIHTQDEDDIKWDEPEQKDNEESVDPESMESDNTDSDNSEYLF